MKIKPPKHKESIHKGQLGRILVIGGSPKYYGAPILTGLAAEASGADLIDIYTCHQHLEVAKKYSLNFFLHNFPENPGYLSLHDVKKVQQLEIDVIAIGNGMGDDFDAKKAMLAIINSDKPIVIDGDALVPELLKIYNPEKHRWVLTPHHREFKRVFGVDAIPSSIEEMAKKYRLNLCVKGKTDYIIACNDFKIDNLELLEDSLEISYEMLLYKNYTGINKMRVGGTGDALAGIIASYIGQGFSALQSLVVATNLFGSAGEALASETHNFTARSLIKFYPKFIARHR